MQIRFAGVAGLAAGALAALFGLATIVSGGQALFGDEAARASVGAAVPFVLWFNFFAGFAYVVAGFGLLMRAQWSLRLAGAIAAATIFVFAAFGVHVLAGGPYEMRTAGAMVLRSLFWIGMVIVALREARRTGNR